MIDDEIEKIERERSDQRHEQQTKINEGIVSVLSRMEKKLGNEE
jgi:hypothetical protein